MYELGDGMADVGVDPGTNLLVSGPPLTGKRRLALEVLAAGSERGEGAVVVTTKDSARRILEAYAGLVEDLDAVDVGIVDCVTRQQGDAETDHGRVRYASSPVDMTGIGIEFSELLEEFYHDRGLRRIRVLLYSLSTMLMYADLETVFRFAHVFTRRVQNVDGLGVYVVDSTAHDDRTMNTLKQLFDGMVTVEEQEGGEPAVSFRGAAARSP